MPRRKHESLGEIISTAVFFGVSLVLILASADSFLLNDPLRGVGFAVAGLFCFLGALRYPIARLYDKLKDWDRNAN